METLNREPDVRVFKVNSKVARGFVISIMLCNNVLAINETYENSKPVIVQKEESTNIYTSSSLFNYGMMFDLSGYNSSNKEITGKDTLFISNEKVYNLNKLNEIATLTDNWNENGAKAIPISLIDNVKGYINFLEVQPEIFPTVAGTLQLEYDRENGAHLEIEIPEVGDADVFIMDMDDNVNAYKLTANVEEINKVVREFYG